MKLSIILLWLICSAPLMAYDELINKVCDRMKYEDCSLVKAIITHESGFNPLSIGQDGAGSIGLMQVKCSTAQTLDRMKKRKAIACKQLKVPEVNVRYGIEYLEYLERLVTPDPTVKEILSMYNGGYRYDKKTDTYRVKYCNAISVKKKRDCKKGELFNKSYVNMVYKTYQKKEGM
jgi:soluble lytic murein transglycosylase-like protein